MTIITIDIIINIITIVFMVLIIFIILNHNHNSNKPNPLVFDNQSFDKATEGRQFIRQTSFQQINRQPSFEKIQDGEPEEEEEAVAVYESNEDIDFNLQRLSQEIALRYKNINVFKHTRLYVCMSVFLLVLSDTYIYIYTHTSAYTYIHAVMFRKASKGHFQTIGINIHIVV
jgi:uncharacterized protein YxeA